MTPVRVHSPAEFFAAVEVALSHLQYQTEQLARYTTELRSTMSTVAEGGTDVVQPVATRRADPHS